MKIIKGIEVEISNETILTRNKFREAISVF